LDIGKAEIVCCIRLPAADGGRRVQEVCGTSNLEIGWGYVKQVEIVVMTARVIGSCLRLSERPVSMREM
jgi:hypothetical protein